MNSQSVKLHLLHLLRNIIPRKEDGRREILRKLLFISSVLVLIVSLSFILSYYAGSYKNSLESNNLRKLHSSTASAYAAVPKLSAAPKSGGMLPEFASLYKINKEIKGWITVSGTNIDYPVVQSQDNVKYLKAGFDRQYNRDGAIFLDYRDRINPLSQSTIIYGHNMTDGQMFNQLDKYERRSGNDYIAFYNASPLITFSTLYERIKWKIFAVFVTTGDSSYQGSLYYLNTGYSSADDFNSFISAVRKRSFINTKVDVKPSDKLLTLSTCEYSYPKSSDGDHARLVVMAREVRPGESTAVAAASKNSNVVYPDCYYKVWNK